MLFMIIFLKEYNQQLDQKVFIQENDKWEQISKIVLKDTFKKSKIPLINIIISSVKRCQRLKKLKKNQIVNRPKSYAQNNRNSFFQQIDKITTVKSPKNNFSRRPTIFFKPQIKEQINYGQARRHSEGQLNEKIKELNFLEPKTYVKQHLQPKKPILKQKKKMSIKHKTRQIMMASSSQNLIKNYLVLSRPPKYKIEKQKSWRINTYSPEIKSNKNVEPNKMSLSGLQESFKKINIGMITVAPLSDQIIRVVNLLKQGKRMRKKTQIQKPLPLVKQKSMNLQQKKNLLFLMNKSRNQISSQESSEEDTICKTPRYFKKSTKLFKTEKSLKQEQQERQAAFNIYYFKSNKAISNYVSQKNSDQNRLENVSPRTLMEMMNQPSSTRSNNSSKRIKTEMTSNDQIQKVYMKQEMKDSEYYIQRKISVQIPSLKMNLLSRKSSSKDKFKPYMIKSSRKHDYNK